MKIDINKQTYTKEEVLELLNSISDEISNLMKLHKEYREEEGYYYSQFDKDGGVIKPVSPQDGYILAYATSNNKILKLISDVRGDF